VPIKAPPDEVPGGSQPSLGPDDVMQPLAGHEHSAEHALDKVNRRTEISAIITEAIAEASITSETSQRRSRGSLKGT
jgi:hypothetical protein